jgi:heparan-alpha-glucosaminide N-acetyltransferase
MIRNGVTIADFVMPFFLFIVGISISISMLRSVEFQTATKLSLVKKVAWRTLKLALLGLFLSQKFPDFDLSKLKVMGVLQRIAFDYFVVSITMIYAPAINMGKIDAWIDQKTADYPIPNRILRELIGSQGALAVLIKYCITWGVALIFIFITLTLTFGAPIPGCGYVLIILLANHIRRGSLLATCNPHSYIDQLIITPDHMDKWPLCKFADPPCEKFEAEGILSTIGSTTTTFIGLYFGHTLNQYQSHIRRIAHWLVIGLPAIGIGLGMHYGGYPFNKMMWSYSYVILMAGSAAVLFTIFYAMIDIKHTNTVHWALMPLIILGMNAIAIFAIDEFLPNIVGWNIPFQKPWFYWKTQDKNLVAWSFKTFYLALEPKAAIFCYALTDVLLMMIIAAVLYYKKKFFKI